MKILERLIHVRRHNLYLHIAALGDVQRDLVGIPGFATQLRCHEFSRVVSFQVRGLVCDHRVRGGVDLLNHNPRIFP